MPEEAKLIYEFQKNSQEIVRVFLKSYRGTPVIDIRVYFPVGGGENRPTKKGITLSTILLPELIRSVEALQDAIEQEADWRL